VLAAPPPGSWLGVFGRGARAGPPALPPAPRRGRLPLSPLGAFSKFSSSAAGTGGASGRGAPPALGAVAGANEPSAAGLKEPSPELSPRELGEAARLARASVFCYREEVREGLRQEGLEVVAVGQNGYTRWVVADGQGGGKEGGEGPPTRHVFLRGVAWRQLDSQTTVGLKLMQAWPEAFEPRLTWPQDSLVAHAGVASIARAVWPELEGLLRGHPGAVVFAGHSMGGSLAVLLSCMCRLRLRLPEGRILPAHAFGSPPVLAHKDGGGGGRVMRSLRLPPSSIRSFVHLHDIIPRAGLAADPVHALLKQAPLVGGLLSLRSALFGQSSMLSESRFLFESCGHVYLLSYEQDEGASMEALGAEEADKVLAMDRSIDRASRDGILAALVQTTLDHSAKTYANDLSSLAVGIRQGGGPTREEPPL